MPLSVDFSKWHVQRVGGGPGQTTTVPGGDRTGVEISRIYDYSEASAKVATIRMDCRLERGLGGFSVNSFFSLYFKPFRVPNEMSFVMGLLTPDHDGGFSVVTACPVEGDLDTALLFVSGKEDTDRCLSAFLSGQHMNFTLMQIETKENLVKLPLPNDGEFKRLYYETYDRLARGKDVAPTEPQDSDIKDEVRKNPKGYAVWMIEQTPGEYGVLLVKLDDKGGMADAWHIGKPFTNRKEQGAFARDLARELQVKLMEPDAFCHSAA